MGYARAFGSPCSGTSSQPDRAFDYGSKAWGLESLVDRHYLAIQYDPALHGVFLWTDAISSVFQIRDIEGCSPQCLDDASMADLDTALELYFEL